MQIKLEVVTPDGVFIFVREFHDQMVPGGVLPPFSKVPSPDAAIIAARNVLDVIPTMFAALTKEYTALAAQKTTDESDADSPD